MNFKKVVIGGIIGLALLSQSGINVFADSISYQAKSGDTYWKISQRYGIDLDELLDENSAYTNPYLNVGQTIKLPFNSDEKLLYKVVWGDTYWRISQKFNVDINELIEVNKDNSQTNMNVNDVIIILKSNNYKGHVVEAGDTYWKISQKYCVDINELLKVNNANQYSHLSIGQKILIPNEESISNESLIENNNSEVSITYNYYTVQKAIIFGIYQLNLGFHSTS